MASASRRAIAKLVRLRPAEWLDLWRAALALARGELMLRLRPVGRLAVPARVEAIHRGRRDRAGGEERELARARELALALDRVARWGPVRSACLARSLALRHLLATQGIAGGRVRFGARKRNDRLEAHAWVELHGEVVGDARPLVESFAPLRQLAQYGDLP